MFRKNCGLLAVLLCLCILLTGCVDMQWLQGFPTVPKATVQPTAQTEPTLPPNPYGPEDFHHQDGFLTCTAGAAVAGIDVSSYQGQVDWTAVKAAGVDFAMIRLGVRGYLNGDLRQDELARSNLEGAKAAGIRVGAYFFSQAVNVEEARQEAALALQILDGFALDMPLVYDWEYVKDTARTANVDRRTLTDCTKAFCEAVKAGGYRPMIYFNKSQALDMLKLTELTAYPWWLAMYDTGDTFPYRVDMWQYTDKGQIPGIQGPVDLDLRCGHG